MEKSFLVFCVVLLNNLVCNAKPYDDADDHEKCGYNACHPVKNGFINFHIMPHTHDDVGWLKTLDQYYYGSEPNIYQAGVQYILDSVVQELQEDHNKRFIYVETAFFWKWWELQTPKVQRIVKRLVSQGRLEFIGGGWSMADEAATHYQSIIDNYSWGFRKLNDTFGECGTPRIGWQIDPFGHARETASIMARIGFDALFFGRADWRDKTQREETKNLELVWEASANLGDEADLFTGILYNTYSAPDGFNFDIIFGNGDDPVIDDINDPDYNVDSLVEGFLEDMNNRIEVYKGSNIAVCMGDDFNYQSAGAYMINIDRLIKALNARQDTHNSKYNFLYSTPSCYAKALNDEGLEWSTKQDDFFPYANDPHAYWSGYYTSRPALKRYERMGNNFLQICKQLSALANLDSGDIEGLDVLREAMGVMQHHDAVAGTERQLVAFDYARLLSIGFDQCGNVTEAALNKLLAASSSSSPVVVESCNLLNVSQCGVSESESKFVVTLYNPLSRSVSRYIKIPVSGDGTGYSVYDYQGESVTAQIVPIPDAVSNIPGRTSKATVELVFQASDLPPLGFRSYYVSKSNMGNSHQSTVKETGGKKITIGWKGFLQLTLNKKTGLPSKITIPEVSQSPNFQQNFFYYESALGNNAVFENRSSGAYIFRPNSSLISISSKPTSVKYYSGDLVEEVQQEFSSWVSQVIRAYKGENYLEFNWVVGPIPISDGIGKEIVSQYIVEDMVTSSTFYTDSNGREMIERILYYRPTFNVSLEEPIAMNYDPITTRIMIKDDTKQVSILTDRSEGGSSLEDGELEVMLHRRCLNDDAFGVAEALNETAFGEGLVVRGSHFLTAGPVINQSAADRRLVQQRVLDAWTFFTPTTLSLKDWQASYKMEYSGLQSDLPQNIQILTLEPWKGTSFLLRLEHILELNDDETASEPVTVNLNDIFAPFTISSVREATLGANRWLDEVTRLVWKKEDSTKTPSKTKLQDLPSVTLKAMDIKTFIVEVKF